MKDRIFTHDSAKFAKNIYATRKGRIREAVLKQDLAPLLALPAGLTVLDAGAGLGQVNQWFAEAGQKVLHLDGAADMVHEAQLRHQAAGVAAQYEYRVATLQSLAAEPAVYDIVCCHAVLEWLTDPYTALRILNDKVAPGGWLSLMFYNRSAKRMANMVYGNHDYVAADLKVKKKVRLSPQQPLDIAQVKNWLSQFPLTLAYHSGIRCFNDYLKEPARADEAQLIELELKYRRTEPYRSLGRYQHFILRKD
ncbi:methyltransferase domain-containing protein [Aliidiomarina quisquiliarum]|uniref:methyltransferase domain-containing protein n=1 Tax=Aliidiomarina quisquiliarum TaxID=2938947 RepID=UPI00208EFCDB|nr:methyltransferase domain-containing protein [Aliidiomarina quisquiliarum]MCO4320875.1 methyltransferase domain-containing protein [Aliidiomarina quisquiliarum]